MDEKRSLTESTSGMVGPQSIETPAVEQIESSAASRYSGSAGHSLICAN